MTKNLLLFLSFCQFLPDIFYISLHGFLCIVSEFTNLHGNVSGTRVQNCSIVGSIGVLSGIHVAVTYNGYKKRKLTVLVNSMFG